MYMTIAVLLALSTLVSSTPLPNADVPESATVVEVATSSYSSLIVYNPAAPTSDSSDTFLTPSGVTLPEPSAILSLQGNLPSTSSSSPGATESGVRVVGQDSSGMESGNATESAVKENSAGVMVAGGWVFVGVGSALVAVLA